MKIPKHALIVATQDARTVTALQDLLGKEHAVQAVQSQKEALERTLEQAPGLILLDVRLAGLQIGEFAQKLRLDPRTSGIPILLLVTEEDQAAPGLKQGANDFLVCPLKAATSAPRIQNYLDLGRCVDALRKFSLVDAVTGIANRRRFDEFLTLEWRRHLRSHTSLSIVLMDLDHFRAYAEHYGVPAGDECLKKVAETFQAAIQRPGDLLACYSHGGFACVLPETDTLGAVSVAERMRAELAELAIPHAASGDGPRLTMSVGVVTRIPVAASDPEEFLAYAEKVLEEAKRAGRNRVQFGS